MNITASAKSKLKAFAENLHTRDTIGRFAKKGGDFARKNKQVIAVTGAMVATGMAGGAVGGAVVGTVASATTRSLITIGQKAHSHATAAKHKEAYNKGESLFKIAKKAGAEFISDLRSPKFQRQLEKQFIEDLAYGAIATAVGAIAPVMGLGDAVAIKASGAGGKIGSNAVQKMKKKVREYANRKTGA